jgi:hypothetical protein
MLVKLNIQMRDVKPVVAVHRLHGPLPAFAPGLRVQAKLQQAFVVRFGYECVSCVLPVKAHGKVRVPVIEEGGW